MTPTSTYFHVQTIPEHYKNIDIPDAAIFTPLLHSIDKGELEPEPYEYGKSKRQIAVRDMEII
eukprot:gene2086-18141_t